MGKESAAPRAVVAAILLGGLLPGAGTAARAQILEDDECWGRPATITGTSGDDQLRGTSGSDVISALGGHDVVHGLGGGDVICAGSGDDLVHGGAGSDTIEGLHGADELFGDGGSDLLLETPLPDDAVGPFTFDVGDSSDDEFYGGPGDDLLGDDGGADLVDGGDGDDTYFLLFAFTPSVIDLTRGYSAATTRTDVNTLVALENAVGTLYSDLVIGNEGPNVLTGTYLPDTVLGEGGSDLMLSMLDGDLLEGGSDRTRDAVMPMTDEPVAADLAAGTLGRRAGGDTPDRLNGIEDVIGSPGDDVLVGNEGTNRLYGGAGNDSLDGGAADDVLVGDMPFFPWADWGHWHIAHDPNAAGEDTLEGGDGHDRLDGGPRRDRCTGGEVVKRCEDSGAGGTRARRAGAAGSWLNVLYPDAPPWLGMLRDEVRRLENAVL